MLETAVVKKTTAETRIIMRRNSPAFAVFGELGTKCPSSYKMGHQSGLSFGGSVSSVGLIMQPAFDVASGDIGLSVS